jgi:trehalose/maltose transport system substrate-binding protein
MRKTFVLPLILLVVVLVACVAPTPTPAPKPTDPPKPTVAPTVVPTVVPTVAPTKAPEPTKAPAPTTAPTQAAISRCGTTANVTITYVGDPAGTYPAAEKATIERFSKICPNITVKRIDGDASGQNLLASYLTAFEAKSSTIDVIRVDVVWPGILAPHLLDMKKYVTQQQIDAFLPGMVQNNTLDGKLVALPLRIGFGMLYYRTDLLQKYGFSAPPATWKELETMAQKIQDGERAAGNKDFWGYVWQGDAFEGLTCNALEWQVSNGGGAIVSPDRKIQVNNKETIAALERAASWVGKISPPGVVKHKEEDSRAIFHAGNAAFMRNWPYVYMPTKGSEVMGTKFDVAPLPAGDSGKGASALGGWQIGVSRYSANPDAAAAFAIYLTSAENMKFLSVETSAPPAIASLYAEPEIKKTMPFANLDIVKITTPRPSTITAQKYNEVSTLYFIAVNKILSGQVDAKSAMAQLELDLQKLLK